MGKVCEIIDEYFIAVNIGAGNISNGDVLEIYGTYHFGTLRKAFITPIQIFDKVCICNRIEVPSEVNSEYDKLNPLITRGDTVRRYKVGADKMENFIMIYRMLKSLEKALDCPMFDMEETSLIKLDTTQERRSRCLEMMMDSGLIKGEIIRYRALEDSVKISCRDIQITLKGLEYLSENSLMQKARELVNEEEKRR